MPSVFWLTPLLLVFPSPNCAGRLNTSPDLSFHLLWSWFFFSVSRPPLDLSNTTFPQAPTLDRIYPVTCVFIDQFYSSSIFAVEALGARFSFAADFRVAIPNALP